MNHEKQSLIGQRFGRLLVVRRVEDYVSSQGYHSIRYLCKCDCGNEVIVIKNNLLRKNNRSCGCLRSDLRIERGRWHGYSRELLHSVWRAMKRRCENPKDKSYQQYGARGISVCSEWNDDYFAFRNWALANGYAHGLSIDRIDPNGNYEPSNCRWITCREQNVNKRSTDYVEYDGVTHPLRVWADILGIKYKTLRARLYAYGMSVERAFSTNEDLRGN